ncbi:bacteriohemerythrin [Campylobacter volucris]|uniref:bacteriohemerythrin n=1 Tax=Campylobacter volucris TaxID=1031542 RepID=UPI00189E4AB4|nr:hemerythrin family protein [Campylobacter volucris]MBF7068239.1 hemerythrin family protein [Campylobacter volucris]
MDTFPIWSDKFSIDEPNIDLQHQILFDLANKAAKLLNRHIYKIEIKELLTEFFDYMKIHFKDEEDYMSSINYPYLLEHKAMHKKIIKEMSVLLNECNTTNDLKERLYEIVSIWLLEHIVEHDMMINIWKKSNLKIEEKKNIVKEKIFDYVCGCENFTHKVDYGIHIKIKYLNALYKCKKCFKELVYAAQDNNEELK